MLPNLQDGLAPLTPKDDKTLIWTRKPHRGWDVRFQSAPEKFEVFSVDPNELLLKWFRLVAILLKYSVCSSVQLLGDFLVRGAMRQHPPWRYRGSELRFVLRVHGA